MNSYSPFPSPPSLRPSPLWVFSVSLPHHNSFPLPLLIQLAPPTSTTSEREREEMPPPLIAGGKREFAVVE